MAPCSSKLLLVNGVPFTGDVPPVATFLQSTLGAYTTTRTYGGASLILFLERHIRRLVHSARLLSQSRPSLFSAGSVPSVFPLIDSVPHRVHDSLEVGLRLALRDRDRSGRTDELAITVLVRGRCDSDGLDVLLHVGFFIPSPFGAFGARLAVTGPGRDLAEAKYSDWVRVRQGLEKMRPPSVTELLLTNDGDSILEGTVTNFFVVRRKVVHDFTEPPPTEQELCSFVVQTAPISDGILPGVIRQLVIEICSSMNIPIEEVAPSWSDHMLWQEAFITTSWLERFGSKTPELTTFAIRVLGLTCSASGCERNWNTFESIHTKKRNRLEHAKLNALVFVKYNFKLRERSIRRRDKIDPIVVDEIDSDDEWITKKEGPVLPVTTKWLEDDELFESDPIVSVPSATFESLFDSDKRIEDVENIVEVPPTNLKKIVVENSSSLRLVQHVETIQFPTSSKILHARSFQEFSWATKQFQGIGHITRQIQNEIINRAAEESFKINQYS